MAMMSHYDPFPVDTAALQIQGLGVQEKMRPCFLDRPLGWPNYLFVLFYDSTPCHTRGVHVQASPGTLICWKPGTPHGLGNPKAPWNHSWLSIGGTDVTRAIRETRFSLDTPLSIYDSSVFDPALAELFGELSRPTIGADAIDIRLARSYVVNIIRKLARALHPTNLTVRAPKALVELRQHIDSHFHEALLLPRLADQVGYSVSQLCLLHKQHFGTGVMAYLRFVRLQRAALLLKNSEMKVRTVGEMVGYFDHYHFSKAFSQQFGQSPASFRTRRSS